MKKCLVLDLDNTLWGGVVGEDGIDGLKLSLTAPGNSFVAFQQVILDLYNRGIILAINSSNNYDDAMRVIQTHPNMILKENNFAAVRINWQDKVQNLQEIAEELNIGLDSLVFLDDEPVNRSMVRSRLPMVETPDLPSDPSDYAKFLLNSPYFSGAAVITDEDKMRGNYYVTERLRKMAEDNHSNREDFLHSLGIEVKIYEDNDSVLPRLSQLTAKTNQFNTNKQPLTEAEIANYIIHPDYRVFYCQASDRFGDYGIIGFALVKVTQENWEITSFLLSCRVIGRGIGETFLRHILSRAEQNQAQNLTILFQKTERNAPAEEFVGTYFKNNSLVTQTLANVAPWVNF